ncbi:dephospho-CoA kinase [Candidatus Pelagibacter sp.]|nr:dephospho-CoA kinase [Candidatus Pelagibacter sp.]
MIRIAILGDIGAGKSFVSKQFNCPLFDADKEVAEIYKNDRSCYQKIKKALPKYIISDHLDKKFLLKAVLDSKNNLKKISKIVHPIVRNRMNKFLIKNKTKKLVVLDIPLYLENKLNKRGDVLIFVEAKRKDIQKRLEKRKYFNKKLNRNLKSLQLPLTKKKKLSNFVIKNTFNANKIKNDVKHIKTEILNI